MALKLHRQAVRAARFYLDC